MKAYSVPSRPRANGKNTDGNTSTEAMPNTKKSKYLGGAADDHADGDLAGRDLRMIRALPRVVAGNVLW